MNIDGLMLIYERRKELVFEKLYECLSRDERNLIWVELEKPSKIIGMPDKTTKEYFEEGLKEGLK